MSVHINYLAVLLAGISSMFIGMIYYSDSLYGKTWKKLAGVDQAKFAKESKNIMPLIFIAALITAYFLAFITNLYVSFYRSSWLTAGLDSALIIWFGFAATSIFIHNSLDQKPIKLTVISLGNRLVSILAMGLIIGWLHP